MHPCAHAVSTKIKVSDGRFLLINLVQAYKYHAHNINYAILLILEEEVKKGYWNCPCVPMREGRFGALVGHLLPSNHCVLTMSFLAL